MDIIAAQALIETWGQTINDRPRPGVIATGARTKVGSLIFQYDKNSGVLSAMGLLFPVADRLKYPDKMANLLSEYGGRHPEFTHGAQINYLSSEIGGQDPARIVLTLKFQSAPPALQFVEKLKQLSSDSYRWRGEIIIRAMDGQP